MYNDIKLIYLIVIEQDRIVEFYSFPQDCVPMLVDIALEEETGESVRLSSLQALTNLSVMDHHHSHYTRIVQKLYDFLDDQSLGIRLQAVKILVNLSCNPELVPHMLAAKVRETFDSWFEWFQLFEYLTKQKYLADCIPFVDFMIIPTLWAYFHSYNDITLLWDVTVRYC